MLYNILPSYSLKFTFSYYLCHFLSDWCYLEALGKEGARKYSKQNKRSFVKRIIESGADQIKLNMNNEDIDMDDFNTMPDPEDLLKMRSSLKITLFDFILPSYIFSLLFCGCIPLFYF